MYYYSSSIVCSNKTIMIYIFFFEQSKLCERRGATVKVVVGKMLKGKSLVKDLLEGRGFEWWSPGGCALVAGSCCGNGRRN